MAMSEGVMLVNWRGWELEVRRSYFIFREVVVGDHLIGGALEKSLWGLDWGGGLGRGGCWLVWMIFGMIFGRNIIFLYVGFKCCVEYTRNKPRFI